MSCNNNSSLIKVYPFIGPGPNGPNSQVNVSQFTRPGVKYYDGPTMTLLSAPAVRGDCRVGTDIPYRVGNYHEVQNFVSYHGVPRGNYQYGFTPR